MTNRLAAESSPYLKQHAENPVDWFPWGEEALQRAKAENKIILLSVGYSACHWCHVMAHECFENPAIADLMNQHFVNIKVDREERPDLDQIYQNVAQLITHSGGWPLTVFLTPELKPVFGGTYFPPTDRQGRAGFPSILQGIAQMYRDNPDGLAENVRRLTDAITRLETLGEAKGRAPDQEACEAITAKLMDAMDWRDGGLGHAPKFPHTSGFAYLWRAGLASRNERALEAVTLTLTKMASGGIYDQLGGGFARYSTDDQWLVPHFEKMLYDNAVLLKLYAEVLLAAPLTPQGALEPWRRDLFLQTIRDTLGWLFREMLSPEGGFYSALDADSEGEEGKFYVWDRAEARKLLTGAEADALIAALGIEEHGNFEHSSHSVLRRVNPELPLSQETLSAMEKLRAVREKRTRPGLDDKVLTGWNALMVSGLVWAARALEHHGIALDMALAEQARNQAQRTYAFLKTELGRDDHRLWATWSASAQPKARFNAYLDDYAFLAAAALDLSQTDDARSYAHVILKHFKDSHGPCFFFTSDDHESLIQRPKSLFDQALPSGNAVALEVMMALAELYPKDTAFRDEVQRSLPSLMPLIRDNPYGHGEAACAALLSALGAIAWSHAAPKNMHPHFFVKRASGGEPVYCHRSACHALPSGDDELAAVSAKLIRWP